MADNKRWFKVWTSLLTDPEFDAIDNWCIGAWVRLGALVAQHGTDGKLTLSEQQFLKRANITNDIEHLIQCLSKINVKIVFNETQLVSLSFDKWSKYQTDWHSYERVKKHRKQQNETHRETVQDKKRREEKRKEENIYSRNFDEIWNRFPNKQGKKEAEKHFNATVKTESDWNNISTALNNYLSHLKANSWKRPQNGSTWFNNWCDWVIWTEPLQSAVNEQQINQWKIELANAQKKREFTSSPEIIARLDKEIGELQNRLEG